MSKQSSKKNSVKCPRCGKEPAIVDRFFGVLPGDKCQVDDARYSSGHSPEFYTISKMHRIQADRDKHAKDHLQPYMGEKANPDFFKAYPDKVGDYEVEGELSKI